MENDRIKERIKFYTEMLKLLTLTIVATISALISLFYNWNEFTGRSFIFAFAGMVTWIIQFVVFYYLCRKSMKLLDTL
jgi:hypothetical protein